HDTRNCGEGARTACEVRGCPPPRTGADHPRSSYAEGPGNRSRDLTFGQRMTMALPTPSLAERLEILRHLESGTDKTAKRPLLAVLSVPHRSRAKISRPAAPGRGADRHQPDPAAADAPRGWFPPCRVCGEPVDWDCWRYPDGTTAHDACDRAARCVEGDLL